MDKEKFTEYVDDFIEDVDPYGILKEMKVDYEYFEDDFPAASLQFKDHHGKKYYFSLIPSEDEKDVDIEVGEDSTVVLTGENLFMVLFCEKINQVTE